MHPRNRYLKKAANFGELAEYRPSLKPFLIDKHYRKADTDPEAHKTHPLVPSDDPAHQSSNNPHSKQSSEKHGFRYTINFSDTKALRELTCAVLEKDFDITLEIPPDRLVPTIPQKLNYIHWIEDLLALQGGVASGESGATSKNEIPKGQSVVGIDVGKEPNSLSPSSAKED